ncbi:MAG: hypothetical protein ABI790_17795 [Betaproteobacteria bacterium]
MRKQVKAEGRAGTKVLPADDGDLHFFSKLKWNSSTGAAIRAFLP